MQAMNVLPLPVAICTKERGRASANDCSRFVMASACTGQRPDSSSGGISVSLRRRLYGVELVDCSLATCCWPVFQDSVDESSHSASVVGVWKEKTFRLRGCGSSPLVNRVSTPVLS